MHFVPCSSQSGYVSFYGLKQDINFNNVAQEPGIFELFGVNYDVHVLQFCFEIGYVAWYGLNQGVNFYVSKTLVPKETEIGGKLDVHFTSSGLKQSRTHDT